MSEKRTETEQLYDGMTAQNKPEDVETQTEQSEEAEAVEDQTDALLEIEREIESYQSKIAKLDEQLAGFKSESIAAAKRKAMREVHYNDDQIERYLSHIEGETVDEIKASVLKLSMDITPVDPYGDPSAMNGAKQKPTHADPGELGKSVYERIKHKIWGGGATL
ncbi:putative RNase H-like nuclease (RuvC/YqgF family) [Lederbergia galactosidilyticus]|uniref:hypothetical protein n=1 Tax=Lederbergia galactosidilytica TaxID=217031 RepID=UPI001AEB1389|nr:hypothetical protein [Lederbergia galactosidilytica]MBP1913244.1 putative RNase H-like nuclease (RuvC/YqgF family) [Lederbergia galactosidilytica]